MTRQTSRGTRAAVTIIFSTLAVLVLSSTPAFAEYRAWFAPWDYAGDFQPGDISEDYTEMDPPVGVCGFRITDPSYYRWTNDDGATVDDGDLYQDVIIWLDRPGCSRPFSVRTADGNTTFTQPVEDGGISMAISTNYGAYWVTDTGYYFYTCGGACVGPTDWTIPAEDIWSHLTVSAFKDVSGSILDQRRQSRVFSGVADLSLRVADLEKVLLNRIATRRRTSLGGLELSVRSLEDAATRALSAARTATDTCAALAQKGFYTDSFVACTMASRDVEASDSLMRAAWFLYHQPATLTRTGS